MLTLVLYGLAALHCTLEGVPGFNLLKRCCFVETTAPAHEAGEDDGCGEVENGGYRMEEQAISAPQPLIVQALFPSLPAVPRAELQPSPFAPATTPPELPHRWQFTLRAALPPRAPSSVS